MSDFGYLHNKTLALNKKTTTKKNKKKKHFLMAYVATTSKLDISIQASIFCMSSEEGSNGYWPSHNTNRRQANFYHISRKQPDASFSKNIYYLSFHCKITESKEKQCDEYQAVYTIVTETLNCHNQKIV